MEVMGNATVFTLYPLYKSHFLKPTPLLFCILYFYFLLFAIHIYLIYYTIILFYKLNTGFLG